MPQRRAWRWICGVGASTIKTDFPAALWPVTTRRICLGMCILSFVIADAAKRESMTGIGAELATIVVVDGALAGFARGLE